jgi:hypothetical protein
MAELGFGAETTHEALMTAFTRSVEHVVQRQRLASAGVAA